VPSRRLQEIWRWNYARKDLQDSMNEDVFVPMIMFCTYQGELKTLVSWPDAIPIALPEVDLMILGREELNKRTKLFSFGKQPGIAVATYESVQKHINSYPMAQGALPYRRVFYEQEPKALAEYFLAQPDMKEKPEIVGFDQVLDDELVQEVTRSK
jgi:hypothetical protein